MSPDSQIRPPLSVYLAALVSRFTTICSIRVGSAQIEKGTPLERGEELVLPLVDERADRLDGLVEDAGRVEKFFLQANLAAGDPGDVEQVVDQADELPHLPFDDFLGEIDILGVVGHLEDGDGVADGGQRVPQLVGEHRQELVLSSVVLAQLFVEPAVFDSGRGHLRKLHDEGLVIGREFALDLVGELDEADAAAVLAQEGRPQPSVGGHCSGICVAIAPADPLWMQLELGSRQPEGAIAALEGGVNAQLLEIDPAVGQARCSTAVATAVMTIRFPSASDRLVTA